MKSLDKGIRKRNSNSDPIKDVNDPSVIFLQDFYYWLVQWESLNQKPREGCLTSETFACFKAYCADVSCSYTYLLNDMKLSRVLTGKFQTDSLESKFGSYSR